MAPLNFSILTTRFRGRLVRRAGSSGAGSWPLQPHARWQPSTRRRGGGSHRITTALGSEQLLPQPVPSQQQGDELLGFDDPLKRFAPHWRQLAEGEGSEESAVQPAASGAASDADDDTSADASARGVSALKSRNRRLTALLVTAPDLQELAALVTEHGDVMDAIATTATLTTAARIHQRAASATQPWPLPGSRNSGGSSYGSSAAASAAQRFVADAAAPLLLNKAALLDAAGLALVLGALARLGGCGHGALMAALVGGGFCGGGAHVGMGSDQWGRHMPA